MSTCFVRLGSDRVRVHFSHPQLSSNNLMLLGLLLSKDTFSFINDRASLAASLKAMYSASLVETAFIDCWLDRQLIAPPLYINIQPVGGLSTIQVRCKVGIGIAVDDIMSNNAMGPFSIVMP